MSKYQVALHAAVDAARQAGELLRTEFHRPGGPRGSEGHAEVDEQAERVIRKKILAAFPAAYLGEETGSASCGDEEHVWVVDPKRGTAASLSLLIVGPEWLKYGNLENTELAAQNLFA